MTFGVSPKATLKVTPKVTFWPENRLRPKGVGEEGVGEKLNRVFSGFFPWQVLEWYVPGPSRHHQIPNFLRTLHLFQHVFFRVLTGFFPGFFRVFKKPGTNLVQFSPTPSMADPLWRSPRKVTQK